MLSGFVHVPSMDAVYWTLFVEMRFYFLVLIVLLFKQIHRAQHLLMFWLLISVLSEIFKIDILRQIFLSNNSHSAYFIAGATFYLIWAKEASIGRVALLIVSWLWGLFGVVGSASEFSNSYNVSHSPLIVFLIITLFFFVFWLVATARTGCFGIKRWSLLGAITYPLYLVHESVGWIILDVILPLGHPWTSLLLTILCMLSIAYIVHVYVEKRFSTPVRDLTFTILNFANKRVAYR